MTVPMLKSDQTKETTQLNFLLVYYVPRLCLKVYKVFINLHRLLCLFTIRFE